MTDGKKSETIVIGSDEAKMMALVMMMAAVRIGGPEIVKKLMDGFDVSMNYACRILVMTVDMVETAYPGLQSIKEKAVNSGGKKENKE